jgi:hypothetical protein
VQQDCAERGVLPDPGAPTEEELEDHRTDHLPYRSWCDHCVQGKAPADPHRKDVGKKRRVPVLAFDYMELYDESGAPSGVPTQKARAAAPWRTLRQRARATAPRRMLRPRARALGPRRSESACGC